MKYMRLWSILAALVTCSLNGTVSAADAVGVAPQNRIENLLVAKAGEGTVLKIDFQQALQATIAFQHCKSGTPGLRSSQYGK